VKQRRRMLCRQPSHFHRLQNDTSLTYENHPDFGDYIFSPTTTSWAQHRQMTNGQPLMLRGSGRRPTDDQIALFQQIDGRLQELTTSAIASIDSPPVKPPRVWFKKPPDFTKDELFLDEVHINFDLSFEFFFGTPTGDRINMWPMVTFSDWIVTCSEWVC
jgi:hypothetical protein